MKNSSKTNVYNSKRANETLLYCGLTREEEMPIVEWQLWIKVFYVVLKSYCNLVYPLFFGAFVQIVA